MRSTSGVHFTWLDLLGDPIRIRVLEGLAEMGEGSATELAERIDASEAALRRHLDRLVTLGVAMERRGASDGLTPGRPAARYLLVPEVHERAAQLFRLLKEPLRT